MQTTITGNLKDPQGTNLANIKVRFFLVETAAMNGTLYTKDYAVDTFTDTSGNFSISVWNNTDSGARYQVEFTDNGKLIDSFLAYIPIKATVKIDEVRIYSGVVGIAPSPIYSDISLAITVLNQRLAEIGSGGTGGGLDSSLYFTKTDSDLRYYQKTDSDGRYYTKTQVDNLFGVTPTYFTVGASQTTFTLPSSDSVVTVKVNGLEMETTLYSVSGTTLTFTGLSIGDNLYVLQQGARAGIVKQEFTAASAGSNVFTLSSPGDIYSVSVDGYSIEPSLWNQSPTTLTVSGLDIGSKVITLRTRNI